MLAISLYKCVPGSIDAPHVGHDGPEVDKIVYDYQHGNCVSLGVSNCTTFCKKYFKKQMKVY